MGYVKCTTCGCDTFLDHSNPNLHYSNAYSNTECMNCKFMSSLKVGDWYQDKKGNYHQKEDDFKNETTNIEKTTSEQYLKSAKENGNLPTFSVSESVFEKAVKYVQDSYCDKHLSTPYMLLGDVAELIKITTGREIDWNELAIHSH